MKGVGLYGRRTCLPLLLFLLPLVSFGQTNMGGTADGPTVDWAVMGAFDINMPMGASSYDNELKLDYGGGIGAAARINFHECWMLEPSILFSYDDRRVVSGGEEVNFARMSVSMPLLAGYRFDLTDNMGLAPVGGVELSGCFSNHIDHKSYSGDRFSLPRRFNVSLGIGAGIIHDELEVDIVGFLGLIPVFKGEKENMNDYKVRVMAKYYFKCK